jgi:hypothetical protein
MQSRKKYVVPLKPPERKKTHRRFRPFKPTQTDTAWTFSISKILRPVKDVLRKALTQDKQYNAHESTCSVRRSATAHDPSHEMQYCSRNIDLDRSISLSGTSQRYRPGVNCSSGFRKGLLHGVRRLGHRSRRQLSGPLLHRSR